MATPSRKDRSIVWVAEGFGAGKLPKAPGTWGSLVGLGWCLVLVLPGNLWFYLFGCLAGIAASIWFCGAAERILGLHDPSSVVLDEICAVPVCFIWPVITSSTGATLDPLTLVTGWNLVWMIAGLAAFRVLDIAKPWPANDLQRLPGGWGVTADDIAAAAYVNILFLIAGGVIHFP